MPIINRRVNPTSRHRGKPPVGKPDLTTVDLIYVTYWMEPTSRHRGKPLVGKPDLTTVELIYNLLDGTNLTTRGKPPVGKPDLTTVETNKPVVTPGHHVATNKIVPLLTCTSPTILYQSYSTKSQNPFFKTIGFQNGLQPQSTYPKYSNATDSSTNSVQRPNS